MLSDDSTSDSDTGIRFKTDSTRRPATNEEDALKNRKSGNQRSDNSRHRDSSRNYSSRKSPSRRRDRSPIRDDKYSKDKHKSDYEFHKLSFSDKDRTIKDSTSRDANKYSSKEERLRLDDKKSYEKESRVSSKTPKNDYEKKTYSTFDSSKDRRSDSGNRLSYKSSKDHDKPLSRSTENQNKHSFKKDKHSPNEFDATNDYHGNGKIDSYTKGAVTRIVEREEKTKARSESPNVNKRSISRDHRNDLDEPEKRLKHDEITNNISPVETRLSDTSDIEQKPISYYNMISTTYDNDIIEKDETIAVSDSSEDEATLRKQLLLLEHELKKTKSKKKSKHRDKRKCPRSSKSQKGGISTDDDYKSQESNAISIEDKSNGDESNEEGEIISDSDEKSSRDDLRTRLGKQKKTNNTNSKHELPDLRDHLSSKAILLEKNTLTSPSQNKIEESIQDVEEKVEGPALPPHMLTSTNVSKNIGPTLPEHLRKKLSEDSERYSNTETAVDEIQISDDEDEDVYGPLPEDSKKSTTSHRRLEERALKMKIDSLDVDKTNENQKDGREEWMLKLPDAKAKHLGLTSRQFRSREGPDLSDRSSWTDTPEEKAMKASGIDPNKDQVNSQKLLLNAEFEFIQQRDAEQEMIVRKHKKKSKRKESLLDIHQKKLKKKKKKEEKEETVRRPFDRDIDLKANRFDDAQKKAIIKKAQLLDTRFSKGESKFL